ncbi:MAG TPA: hypothetical protein VJ984_15245 [Xanthomonadales bacterium]|nr:hypothetical protein [Xanthomonadales bacterium]
MDTGSMMFYAAGLAIAFYGLFVAAMSFWILVNPESWSRAATYYCRQWYMHPVEIGITLLSGVIFLVYAPQSISPTVFKTVGHFLLALGAILMLVPPSRHRQFGAWSIEKIRPVLRTLAVPWLVLGVLLIWFGLGGS